jgi:hypothetical protein
LDTPLGYGFLGRSQGKANSGFDGAAVACPESALLVGYLQYLVYQALTTDRAGKTKARAASSNCVLHWSDARKQM